MIEGHWNNPRAACREATAQSVAEHFRYLEALARFDFVAAKAHSDAMREWLALVVVSAAEICRRRKGA